MSAGLVAAPLRIRETVPLVEAGPMTGRRMRIKVITPGWGSSGYYPASTLEQMGKDQLVQPGTHMYLDHPTETEEAERPERSVRDLAAVTVTTAVWDPDQQALMAEADVFAPYRETLAEMAPHIGVSIRASGLAEPGEAEGRQGLIITRVTEVHSVDFVTAAGRGGEIVALLESARATRLEEARNVGAWLEAGLHTHFTGMADRMYAEGRLTRPERICLSNAVGDALGAFVTRVEADAPHLYSRDIWADPGEQSTVVSEAMPGGLSAETLRQALQDQVTGTYGGKDIWAYVQDFTDQNVTFRVEDPESDGTGLYQQPYTVKAEKVALTGDRVEVRATTVYTPVAEATALTPAAGAPSGGGPVPPSPAPPGGVLSTSREGAARMAEIPDTELTSLREAASRTLTAESERDEARRDLVEARAQVERLGDNSARLVEAERREREALTENARLKAIIQAGPVIDRALSESQLPSVLWPRVTAVVMGPEGRAIPVNESGVVDPDKLGSAITAAIDAERTVLAALAETAGTGVPRGLGGGAPGDLSEADIEAETARILREAAGMSESAARVAAKGR